MPTNPVTGYYVAWIMATETLRPIHSGSFVRAINPDEAEDIIVQYLRYNVCDVVTNITISYVWEAEAPDERLYITALQTFEEQFDPKREPDAPARSCTIAYRAGEHQGQRTILVRAGDERDVCEILRSRMTRAGELPPGINWEAEVITGFGKV